MQRPRRLTTPRGTHAVAWTLATGAATTLSWFGVHSVLDDTSYDPPRSLPVSRPPAAAPAPPQASSTRRASPSPRTTRPAPSRTAARPPERSPERSTRPASPPRRPASGQPAGQVRGATVPGGRAVFEIGARSATLVSATPETGWEMKVWHAQGYIRVTFSNGAASSSVFCRWDDTAPRIETFDG
ncbi:hypothetical protein [Streptomyces albus]|uniref:hypothetical protein n=1 Tax=Streptomyces albus TaxID=1888 RepID=UPI0033C1B779